MNGENEPQTTRRTLFWQLTACLCSLGLMSRRAVGDGKNENWLSVPVGESDEPKLVRAKLVWGTLKVAGYDGNEVRVAMRNPQESELRGEEKGLKRLDSGLSLLLREKGNVIEVGLEHPEKSKFWSADLHLQVPRHLALELAVERGGEIRVEEVDGSIKIDHRNGSVYLTRISGPTRVDAANGEIVVAFSDVPEDAAMSFVTKNGKVDIALPQDARLDLEMRAPRGGVFTDLDIEKVAGDLEIERSLREDEHRIRSGAGAMHGRMNGGGPTLTLSTMNGSIYLRRAS